MESQQLQHQLQRVQQEEMEANPDGTIPTDQPRRSDQIRRRLMQLDHNIKQVDATKHGVFTDDRLPLDRMDDAA